MNDVESILVTHPFFRGLDGRHLASLSRHAQPAVYDARDLIFQEGDAADCFFLLIEGRVAIQMFTPDRGPVTIQTIDSGDTLGWSWLIEPYQWSFDAQAIERTETIRIEAANVRDAMRSDIEFGNALLSRFVPVIVDRLQATRMQLLDLYHVHT